MIGPGGNRVIADKAISFQLSTLKTEHPSGGAPLNAALMHE
jgi:hypothetical protein